MKSTLFLLLFSICLISASRPAPSSQEAGGYFGPGSGFNIPGFGPIPVGGFGSGYGGRGGGISAHGFARPVVTCTDKGPCYKKKLQCPAKCFSSSGSSGKGYGYGGGGGGCTMDCKKKCIAYC